MLQNYQQSVLAEATFGFFVDTDTFFHFPLGTLLLKTETANMVQLLLLLTKKKYDETGDNKMVLSIPSV